MYFKFHKRLQTTEHSIFYSVIQRKDKILAIGRRHFYNERWLKMMTLDENFDVLDDTESILIKGEDPRCFYHNNDLYVQDNYWNDMHLINVDDFKSIPIGISGKNISFISRNNKLYFIHYMAPFSLYELEPETGEIFPIQTYSDFENFEYRGGTPGYHLQDDIYYGFGHRTYTYEDTILHDIFYWEVDFSYDKPYISIYDIEQPPEALNICDPTSVIEIGDKKYLITAETIWPWFQYQDYITNIYEIC